MNKYYNIYAAPPDSKDFSNDSNRKSVFCDKDVGYSILCFDVKDCTYKNGKHECKTTVKNALNNLYKVMTYIKESIPSILLDEWSIHESEKIETTLNEIAEILATLDKTWIIHLDLTSDLSELEHGVKGKINPSEKLITSKYKIKDVYEGKYNGFYLFGDSKDIVDNYAMSIIEKISNSNNIEYIKLYSEPTLSYSNENKLIMFQIKLKLKSELFIGQNKELLIIRKLKPFLKREKISVVYNSCDDKDEFHLTILCINKELTKKENV